MKPMIWSAILFLSLLALPTPAHARMDQDPTPAPANLTPKQILAGIYQPWTGPLAQLGKNLRPGRDYVVWVHVPAQHPMDMRSSEDFHRWALATPLTQLTISHNMVAFRCRNSDGKMVSGATGMTGSSNLQDAKALLAGYGISVFFAVYTDGHLNPEAEVDQYVTKNVASRGAVFTAFEVTPAQCAEMQGFLGEFVRHPNKPYRNFSNVGDPERFEGGGCVRFASALMKKAGLLDTVIPSFYRDFYAARYLMGGNLAPQADVIPPATPWLKGERRSISFNLLWNSPWDQAPPDFPGYVHLRQMDPEKMLYALKQFGAAYLSEERDPQRREAAEKTLAAGPLGLRTVVDAYNLDGTGGNSQFETYPIDDRFDPEMAETGRRARAWLAGRAAAGFHVRLGQAVGMPVLLLERD